MDAAPQIALEPHFAHRFSHDQIKASYRGLEDAFARGDYNLVAVLAPDGSELKGCATVLCGFVERGSAMLQTQAALSARGLLCSAFAAWWSDQRDEALALLGRIPADDPLRAVGDRLAALVGRDEIPIFITAVALPILTAESQDERKPVQRYGQFVAKLVGTGLENAYPYRLTEPFDEFVDGLPENERPAFAFAMTPQWFLPKNYERTPIPKILWSHDGDYFLSRCYDNYGLQDVVIAATSQEHFELSQAFGTFCASNIMSDTLCNPSEQVKAHGDVKRDIDVLFTGSSLNAYHTEKAKFLYHLAKLVPDRKIVIVDGHLPEAQYFDLISRAKFLPIINRYAGQPSPRWRDALMNRTMLLYPVGTPYSEITAGAFPYRPESIAEDIRYHLEQYDQAQPGSAYDPATAFATLDRDLAFVRAPREKQFERQLKFCALMACWHAPNPKPHENASRRWAWLVPSVDCFLFGQPHVIDTVEAIAESLDDGNFQDDRDFSGALQLYRQICIQSEGRTLPTFGRKPQWDRRLGDLNREGQRRFPTSLTLKLGDAIWEMYDPHGNVDAAIAKFDAILRDYDALEIDPRGADFVIGYSMYLGEAYVFPDYEYGQQVVKESVYRHNPALRPLDEPTTKQILHAAVHCFLAKLHLGKHHHVHAVEHLRAAMAIWPHNRRAGEMLLIEYLKIGTVNAGEAKAIIREMLNTFRALVREYPAMLLTEFPPLLPYFELMGTEFLEERQQYLAAWERFAQIIHFPGQYRDRAQDDQRLLNLIRYAQYFSDDFRHALNQMPEPPHLRSYLLHDLIPKYRTAVQLGAVPGLAGAARAYISSGVALLADESLNRAVQLEKELGEVYASNTWRFAVRLRQIATKTGLAGLMARWRRRKG